jgi:hypothetical protein
MIDLADRLYLDQDRDDTVRIANITLVQGEIGVVSDLSEVLQIRALRRSVAPAD